MNRLTGADVLVEDRLFATLDTTTRAWDVRPGPPGVPLRHRRLHPRPAAPPRRVVPRTLEEARRADLLLHVVDAGDPDALAHVDVVEETLSRIGAGGVPRLAVLNQVDRVTDPLGLRVLAERLPGALPVSAITGEGLDALAEAVLERVVPARHRRRRRGRPRQRPPPRPPARVGRA